MLGDSTFATFGVGTSLAIEGAYFLAGEISKIQTSMDSSKALETYEKAFRTIQGKHGDLPYGFPQIAFPQTAWGLKLGDSALWVVMQNESLQVASK